MTDSKAPQHGSGCPVLDSYDPASDDQLVDPFSQWAVARRETPVFFSPVLQAYVATRYEDLGAVLNDAETFSSADILRPLNPNPPDVEAILAMGASLARAELRVAFEQLSRRLPTLRLAAGGPTGYARNVTVRMPLGLPVQWDA